MTRVGGADGGTPNDQLGGGGSIPTPALGIGKAHQRLIRERRAREDADVNLFGRWWEGLDLSPAKSRVREVTWQTAQSLILRYEWLGTMPAISWHYYGIYFDGHLGGVVVYAPEYGENIGVWEPFGFTGKIVLLARGACVHWAPPYAASKLIRWSMKLLPPRYEVVAATVDSRAGEVGTIYQACGFEYVGAFGKGNGAFLDEKGREWGERKLQRRFGHKRLGDIARLMPHWTRQERSAKGRYFAFRGPNAEQHREAIAHLLKPYPKRQGAA